MVSLPPFTGIIAAMCEWKSHAGVTLSDEAESGRGLLLVEAVSDAWDWYTPAGAAGKVVWARVETKPQG